MLTLSILPLAGLSLAPGATLATLPYAAFYAGAAVASLPASLLLDVFGRRAAFSLGASLGVAGGLILTWSLTRWHFGGLVLGSFWLGIASGFSLFYRHAAVPLAGKGASALLVVFGMAAMAGLAAPTVASMAEALATPMTFVGVAAAAALAHVGSLAATAVLPYRWHRDPQNGHAAPARWRPFLVPTMIGALGWFVMTAVMGAMPIAMVGCSLSNGVPGAVAWHVVAMYGPSLVLLRCPGLQRPVWMTLTGCAFIGMAVLSFGLSNSTAGFSISAAVLGIGWSLVSLGTTLWVHSSGPSRWLLGLHDGIILGGLC
ncbi:MFS transporter [Microvirga aerophila]|uniref:MFS transporter n=1 Tax=Microvirga aerophila TaxID=670291 RepID=UPI001FE14A44|nr:MFS transporter [Microvirga aerophila]